MGEQGIFTWNRHFYAVNVIEALGLAPHGMLQIGFLHYNTADEISRVLDPLAWFDRCTKRGALFETTASNFHGEGILF